MGKLAFNIGYFFVAIFGLTAVVYERNQAGEGLGLLMVFLAMACLLTVLVSSINIKDSFQNMKKIARKDLMRRVIEKQRAKH